VLSKKPVKISFLKPIFVIATIFSFSCATHLSKSPRGFEKVFSGHDEKRINWLNRSVRLLLSKRLSSVYNHTMLQPLRSEVDCREGYCPKIDIWKYLYKDKDGQLIESDRPISSLKKHWKNPNEARIISITLFGEKRLYYDLLLEYLESMRWMSEVNGFVNKNWGFESFTVRIYVAKRNPKNSGLGYLQGEVSDQDIDLLLNSGCEIAMVDNEEKTVGVDAFYWRFAIVNEPMPANQSIRYLVRDADWKATALELYALADWIRKGDYSFHRLQPFEACMVAVTGSLWGGFHMGENYLYPDILKSILDFPYRSKYGDDEMYLHYVIWPHMKEHKPIISHIYERVRSNIRFWMGNPYAGSCQEPTQQFCDQVGNNKQCKDIRIPAEIVFPGIQIGLRKPFKTYKKKKNYFNFYKINKNKKVFDDILQALQPI